MPSAVVTRGPRRGTGALDPLALQVGRDVAAVEAAGAGVADEDVGAADRGVGWQERDGLALALAAQTPLDARAHQLPAIRIERRERRHRLERGGREHVRVVVRHPIPQPQRSDCTHATLRELLIFRDANPAMPATAISAAPPVVRSGCSV